MKNLFDIPVLGPLLRSPWPWRLTRCGLLGLTLLLAAYGWHHHAIPGVAVKDPLMYTNLATFCFWVLWIMAVVFVALFFGRAWCAVCPLGWLNGLCARIGLQWELPRALRNFIPVTLTLIALQMAVYLLAIHRYPDYTAILLAVVLLATVTCGLLFRKRAFCSLLCPAGAVFGLYARLAPFQLRVRDPDICAACDSQECVSGGTFWKRFSLGPALLYWHGCRNDCPVELIPTDISDSATCTLCLHCAHNCGKRNILIGFRPWLADLAHSRLSRSEAFFFVVLLGMLSANFAKVYTDLREAVFWLPQQIAVALGWGTNGFYFFAALWVTLGFPLLLLLPGYLVERLAGMRHSQLPEGRLPAPASLETPLTHPGFWHSAGRLALACIPLLMAVHVVLAVVKLNAKGAYLPFVLRDPSGVQSYLAMNVMHTVTQPGVIIPLDILKWLVLALVAAGFLLSVLAARRVATNNAGPGRDLGYLTGAITVVTLLTVMYGAVVIRWLFIR